MQQTIAPELEIVVIDNHSQDDSIGVLRNRLKKYANVHIVETSRNKGFGGGYNAGARHAHGTYLLINNPPKILESDAVEKLVRTMEADQTIGILAPKLIHPDGTIRTSARAFPSPVDLIVKRTTIQHIFPKTLRRYLQLDVNPEEPRSVDWVVGGCFVIRKNLFYELHGFDERFFLFFEDTDLCQRVRERGMTVVYDPTVAGRDRKQRLSEGNFLQLLTTRTGRSHVASALKYFWKWKGKGLLSH